MQMNFSFSGLGRPFLVLCTGATISLTGTLLISFALNVWVFQHTGSAVAFSGMLVASILPALLILPWAGNFADRSDRRYVLIAAAGVKVILAFMLVALLWNNSLVVWHLYVFNVIASTAQALEMPAYKATYSMMLSKDQITRANGLMGFSGNLIATFTPVAAGGLIGLIDLSGIVLIDVIMCCVGTTLVVKVISSLPPVDTSVDSRELFSIRRTMHNFAEALYFFNERRLLIGLLAYGVILNSLIALISTLITPLVLSKYTARELGLIMSTGAVGSMIGSGLLFGVENPRRLMAVILACDAILSICVLVAGSGNSVYLYLGCAFLGMMVGAVGAGCSSALWMRKIPLERQGRVFALMGTIAMVVAAIVVVAGGFVADNMFEPALEVGGFWAGSLGSLLGTGKGRGLSLVFVICGMLSMLLSLAGLTDARFRNIDSQVPDER